MTQPSATLLKVEDLRVTFARGTAAEVTVVDSVSFSIRQGQTVGIVGESGSGKSVTALSLMGLLPRDAAEVTGSIRFGERDLLGEKEKALRDMRGNAMAMIFQEPMTSLNPAHRIGDQISESLIRHKGLQKAEARARAIEMLRLVKIPAPERRYDDFPYQLSGGMRQRVMIAIALACSPKLLIADEPTTALDVTVQAQILHLMRKLREETGAAVALITHDLGVVAQVCDEVVVMYAGQVVERAPAAELFAFPQHPYTIGLLGSIPRFGAAAKRDLPVIRGVMPNPRAMPAGCRFAPRCPFRVDLCMKEPPLSQLSPSRATRCWRAPLEKLVA